MLLYSLGLLLALYADVVNKWSKLKVEEFATLDAAQDNAVISVGSSSKLKVNKYL
jgi:hypothetical protein